MVIGAKRGNSQFFPGPARLDRHKKSGTLVGSLLVDVTEEQAEDPTEAASGDWDSVESPVPEPALEFGVLSGSRATDKKPSDLRIDATAAVER